MTYDLSGLKNWYEQFARPFLRRVEPERVAEFDDDLDRLRNASEILHVPSAFCFLGSSGVGKSTLINALVAEGRPVVPSGGVGPLTAQALIIQHSIKPSFRATYHPAKHLNQLAFGLQQSHRQLLAEADPQMPLGQAAAESLQGDGLDNADDEPAESKATQFRRQAALLIRGKQDADVDVRYLLDGLRSTLGQDLLYDSEFLKDDLRRIERLRRRLNGDEPGVRLKSEVTNDAPHFQEALADHAAGFLAPIIEKLEVMWPSALLSEGALLVDLPGLGIEGDVYRQVTHSWISDRAKAVILVVDHRGVTEANAQLLRTSGFLNRLLHSSYDPSADPVSVIVVVVKVDDIAVERRHNDVAKLKRLSEHFQDVRSETVQLIRRQIRPQLESAWSLEENPTAGKQAVIDGVLKRMQIHAVSAIQYRKLHVDDDEDRAFIKVSQDSGVPDLITGLMNLARTEREHRQRRFAEAKSLFDDRLHRELQVIQERWQETPQITQAAEKLRADLQAFLPPLREEFRVRQGAFREFLKETLPQRIELLVSDAKVIARRKIRSYLVRLQGAHWKTLQAAVRRGGVYRGAKHIELPRDFALTFEEPVAEVWGEKVLKEIRHRTGQYADDCLELVQQVVVWAAEQGVEVNDRLIESQQEAIKSSNSRLKNVGRDVADTLRQEVTSKLGLAIEVQIRSRCESFVASRKNSGTGVQARILELFEELADEAVEAAVEPAREILLGGYQSVQEEIRQVFDQQRDPLQAASEAIVESEASRLQRSDAEKRKAILDNVAVVLERHRELEDSPIIAERT